MIFLFIHLFSLYIVFKSKVQHESYQTKNNDFRKLNRISFYELEKIKL